MFTLRKLTGRVTGFRTTVSISAHSDALYSNNIPYSAQITHTSSFLIDGQSVTFAGHPRIYDGDHVSIAGIDLHPIQAYAIRNHTTGQVTAFSSAKIFRQAILVLLGGIAFGFVASELVPLGLSIACALLIAGSIGYIGKKCAQAVSLVQ